MDLSSPHSLPGDVTEVARRYADLEASLRREIDPLTARVCPACETPCCRHHYCRKTGENPWYRLVSLLTGGFRLPPDWAARRDAFGIGTRGCEIRSGRYVFCYSYNCPRLLDALPGERECAAFQELSDLMLLPNRLPGGRFLHELRREEDLSPADLDAIARGVERALGQLAELSTRM